MNLYDKKHAWVLGGFEYLRADTTVEADPGSGGASFAVDAAAGGELHPYAKMEFGASGTQTPVSTSNPLPVVQTGTPALPTGAATAARQDTGNTSLATLAGAVSGTEMQVDVVSSAAIPVTDNGGALTVDDGGSSITVDGTVTIGTSVTPGTGATNLGKAEDAAHSSGDVGVMALAVRRDSAAASSGTDGDYEPLSTDANGLLRVNASGANVPVTDAGGSLTVDDGGASLTIDGSVSLAAAIPAGTNNIGDVDIASIAAGDNNIGNVDIVTMPNVTLAAGTNTNEVVGDVAHDAAAAGNPVLVAARANANEPTAVADADSTYLWADPFGRLVVLPGHPSPEAPATVNATASGNTTVIAAPGANVSLYICKGSIHNSGASNITAILQDGAGGTARWAAELAAEGGGSMFDFGARGWKLTANTLLNVNLSAGGDVRVNVSEYYIAA